MRVWGVSEVRGKETSHGRKTKKKINLTISHFIFFFLIMARTTQKLTDFGKQVLHDSRIEGNRLYLTTQMDRKQYVDLNKILELLGWKWNRWQKCHIFDCENLREAIDEICETMEIVDIKVLYQQYYTPSVLATRLVELACVRETDYVLEPSAWRGAIVEAIPENVEWLRAVEIDPNNYNHLWSNYFIQKTNKHLVERNFLQWSPNVKFDKIVANPPFSKSQDVKHILKMYECLKEWWRIVSIASSAIQTRSGKLYDEFHALNPEFIEIEDGAFKDSGTMVNSVIVIIDK